MAASTAKRRPSPANVKAEMKGRQVDWLVMKQFVEVLSQAQHGTANLARMGRMINERLEADLKAGK
jgi:hypothetical protein